MRRDREDYEGRVTGEKFILLADGVTEFGMAYGSEHPYYLLPRDKCCCSKRWLNRSLALLNRARVISRDEDG